VAGGKTDSPLHRVTRGKAKIISDDRGNLGVIELAGHAPFVPVRIFWIHDVPPGTARGGHAHKACSQFLVCLRGRISVDAIDGTLSRNFILEQGDFLNLVPGIYSTQFFMDEGTVLAVLCDRPYEPQDYVYERDLFVPSPATDRETMRT
jgi:UDP-2-acetamido-3-amino-2,3-dideoxy-glucuronate N-acetyltransferase